MQKERPRLESFSRVFDIRGKVFGITVVNLEILSPRRTPEKSNKYSGKKCERKFKCDEKHSTTKDFRCDICDLAFNTEDKLRKDSANDLDQLLKADYKGSEQIKNPEIFSPL